MWRKSTDNPHSLLGVLGCLKSGDEPGEHAAHVGSEVLMKLDRFKSVFTEMIRRPYGVSVL